MHLWGSQPHEDAALCQQHWTELDICMQTGRQLKLPKRHCVRPAPPPKAGASTTTKLPGTQMVKGVRRSPWTSGAGHASSGHSTPVATRTAQSTARKQSSTQSCSTGTGTGSRQLREHRCSFKLAKLGSAMAARGRRQLSVQAALHPMQKGRHAVWLTQVCGKAGGYTLWHSSAVPTMLREPSKAALHEKAFRASGGPHLSTKVQYMKPLTSYPSSTAFWTCRQGAKIH